MKTSETTKKISEEIAIIDLEKFLRKYKTKEFRRGKITPESILEDYPDVIEAIQDGYVVFDEKNHPTFELRVPVETESKNKELGVFKITFRSRIRPSDKASIMDGLNVQTQQAKYVLRYLSYIIEEPIGVIDRLDPEDYDVVNQICSVF